MQVRQGARPFWAVWVTRLGHNSSRCPAGRTAVTPDGQDRPPVPRSWIGSLVAAENDDRGRVRGGCLWVRSGRLLEAVDVPVAGGVPSPSPVAGALAGELERLPAGCGAPRVRGQAPVDLDVVHAARRLFDPVGPLEPVGCVPPRRGPPAATGGDHRDGGAGAVSGLSRGPERTRPGAVTGGVPWEPPRRHRRFARCADFAPGRTVRRL